MLSEAGLARPVRSYFSLCWSRNFILVVRVQSSIKCKLVNLCCHIYNVMTWFPNTITSPASAPANTLLQGHANVNTSKTVTSGKQTTVFYPIINLKWADMLGSWLILMMSCFSSANPFAKIKNMLIYSLWWIYTTANLTSITSNELNQQNTR